MIPTLHIVGYSTSGKLVRAFRHLHSGHSLQPPSQDFKFAAQVFTLSDKQLQDEEQGVLVVEHVMQGVEQGMLGVEQVMQGAEQGMLRVEQVVHGLGLAQAVAHVEGTYTATTGS